MMAELSRYNSTASLFEPEPEMASQAASAPQNSMFRDFLRHVRLLLLSTPFRRRSSRKHSSEKRKVAIYQSRKMAALTSLLHFPPLGAAIVLLVLYWTRYWIDNDPTVLTALQFVAKFHEILMQASLVDVLVYFIRSQALEGYIPLGALSGAAQASQLSYLWSLDFKSAIASPTFGMWRRVTFGMAVLIMMFMITAVGPSAAVLMIPRPDMPNFNTSAMRYLNMSEASLYPLSLDRRSNFNLSNVFNGADISVLGFTHDPEGGGGYFDFAVLEGSQILYSYHPPAPLNNQTATAVVTGPTDLSWNILLGSDAWNQFSGGDDTARLMTPNIKTTFTLQSPQPYTLASCSQIMYFASYDIYSLDGSKKLLGEPRALYEEQVLFNQTFETTNRSSFPTLWTTASGDPHTLIGISPAWNVTAEGKNTICKICTMSAFWRSTTASLGMHTGRFRVSTEIPRSPRNTPYKDLSPIAISPTLMDGLPLDFDSDSQATAMELAMNVTNALSFVPDIVYRDAIATDDEQRYKAITKGFNLSELEGSSEVTPFRVVTTNYGFGYGMRNTSTQLSVAVITAYCVVVVAYVGYIIVTGHMSVAWSSPTELIMLALQSKEPKDLGHVSVGIDSTQTLRRKVGIRACQVAIEGTGEMREKLELVFEDDETEKRNLLKVVRNRAY